MFNNLLEQPSTHLSYVNHMSSHILLASREKDICTFAKMEAVHPDIKQMFSSRLGCGPINGLCVLNLLFYFYHPQVFWFPFPLPPSQKAEEFAPRVKRPRREHFVNVATHYSEAVTQEGETVPKYHVDYLLEKTRRPVTFLKLFLVAMVFQWLL